MNDSNMDKISAQLGQKTWKRIRAKKKMSQGDIARALEVMGAISNIENGKKKSDPRDSSRIANALGVSPDELLK